MDKTQETNLKVIEIQETIAKEVWLANGQQYVDLSSFEEIVKLVATMIVVDNLTWLLEFTGRFIYFSCRTKGSTNDLRPIFTFVLNYQEVSYLEKEREPIIFGNNSIVEFTLFGIHVKQSDQEILAWFKKHYGEQASDQTPRLGVENQC